MKHILVVDDEKNIRDLIEKYLSASNYQVTTYGDAKYLAEEVKRLKPDLIVLDIMMPNSNGLEICKDIRKFSDVPIVFVSAKDEEFDRILGLELGGDDYLNKPFSPRELVVRIKNIFKRLEKSQVVVPKLSVRDVIVSTATRQILVKNKAIKITQKEFEVFAYLVANLNLPITREQLIEEIWGYDFDGENRVVDDLVKRLRKKLKEKDSTVEIETVWGYGYKIEA